MFSKYLVYITWGILLMWVIVGCKPDKDLQNERSEEEIVTLRILNIGTPPEEGMSEFYKQLDVLTQRDLRCIVRFDFIPWGDERNQINIAVASGTYDFIPNGVFSDYTILAGKNAFVNLYDYMQIVPDLEAHYKQFREDYLENYEINGKLYGLPQYKGDTIVGYGQGFFYREDLRLEWGLKPVVDLDTMEAYLYRAHEDERYEENALITDNRIWTNLWNIIAGDKYLEVNSIYDTPYVVVRADDPTQVISRFETEEFKYILTLLKQWYDDGILESSILAASGNEGLRGLEMMKQDQKPCETNSTLWVMNKTYIPELYEIDAEWEFEYYDYLLGNAPTYVTTNTASTSISISNKSNNIEVAMKFLEKAHTNQEYYDLLNYGIKGIHYNVIDSYINYSGIGSENIFSSWIGLSDYNMDYNHESINRQWQDVVDREEVSYGRYLDIADRYPLDGFNLNAQPYIRYYDSMEEVESQYFQPLLCGITSDVGADYEEAIGRLKDAGLEAYIREVQQQINQFMNP